MSQPDHRFNACGVDGKNKRHEPGDKRAVSQFAEKQKYKDGSYPVKQKICPAKAFRNVALHRPIQHIRDSLERVIHHKRIALKNIDDIVPGQRANCIILKQIGPGVIFQIVVAS